MMPRIPGARLSFVVVDLKDMGQIEREVVHFEKGKGLVREMKTQDAGYMVYFPRGHAIRIRNDEELRRYGFHREPRIINMTGLSDPNSPVGKMMMAQDDEIRKGAYADLEKMVIRLATAKSGNVLMPEQMDESANEAA